MNMTKMAKLDKKTKIIIGSACALSFSIFFGFLGFPKILNIMLKKEMSLTKGTDLRDMWTKFPFSLTMKFYLFNYTNPEDIMMGHKPIINEIGPYSYDEWKEKVNMEDIEEEDAIYYNRRDIFFFNEKETGRGLTGDEIITIPHPILIAIVQMTWKKKPIIIDTALKAAESIFDTPKTFFFNVKVKDLLFDGVNINCDRQDFPAKATCTLLKKEKAFQQHGNNQLKFSLFGMKNGTIEEAKFKVARGIKNIMDVGKVLEFDSKNAQTIWSAPECNNFGDGTDGTVFPPFLTIKDDIVTFSSEICRTLSAWYVKKSSYKGIATNRYVSNLGDLPNEPKFQCFCDTPTTCPKKGLMDVTKCLKGPFVASLPHFLFTDPSVQDGVIGFFPDEEKHGIELDFEPISGTPLRGFKRLQINLQVLRIENSRLFNTIAPDGLLPLFWAEEGLALNKTFINMLRFQLFIPMKIVATLKWLSMFGGFMGLGYAAYLKYKKNLVDLNVSPPQSDDSKKNGEGKINDPNKKTQVFPNARNHQITVNTIQGNLDKGDAFN